jgi:putative endonuclease
MPAYYTYIVECTGATGRVTYYTGYTNDLVRRISEHSAGKGARYTKSKQVRVVYTEIHTSRTEAMRREREIKALSRGAKLRLIEARGGDH